jgi:hypothetical protein
MENNEQPERGYFEIEADGDKEPEQMDTPDTVAPENLTNSENLWSQRIAIAKDKIKLLKDQESQLALVRSFERDDPSPGGGVLIDEKIKKIRDEIEDTLIVIEGLYDQLYSEIRIAKVIPSKTDPKVKFDANYLISKIAILKDQAVRGESADCGIITRSSGLREKVTELVGLSTSIGEIYRSKVLR